MHPVQHRPNARNGNQIILCSVNGKVDGSIDWLNSQGLWGWAIATILSIRLVDLVALSFDYAETPVASNVSTCLVNRPGQMTFPHSILTRRIGAM
jgi:hypothetical protein